MKKLFTFTIALLGMFAMLQSASALVYTATVPAGTFECYIAGNFPAPMNWAPTDPGAKMTKVDDTHFTITLANTDATMKYKYCSGPDWKYVEKDAAGLDIVDRTYSAADVVLSWALIYNPTVLPVPKTVTIEAQVPDSISLCYLVGSFNNWAGALDSTKMVRGVASGGVVVFSITLHVPDVNTLQFKVIAGPGWDYDQLDPVGNFTFPAAETYDGVVVNAFKKVFNISKAGTVKITATVPTVGSDSVWIVGSFSLPNWTFPTAIKGVKNGDGTFSFTVPGVIAFSYVCINKLDWAYKEIDPLIPANGHPDRTAAYPADATTNITVAGWLLIPTTAVPEVKTATNKIYSVNRMIVVENVTSEIAIFDLSGRILQSNRMAGTFTSNALNKGLYIVRVDGATRKVSVN